MDLPVLPESLSFPPSEGGPRTPGNGVMVVRGVRGDEPQVAMAGLPPGVSPPGRVPTGYMQRRGGVEAEVRMNGQDADILTRMRQMAAMCYAMAEELNRLQGVMASTRALTKSLRVLAADLQEEVDVRLGPQGL